MPKLPSTPILLLLAGLAACDNGTPTATLPPTENHQVPDNQGPEIIQQHCTSCHSEKIIQQKRATREGWQQTILWMQSQGLRPLKDETERILLDYLAEHFAPEQSGRRAPLQTQQWYQLEPSDAAETP